MTQDDLQRFGTALGKLCVAFNRPADDALTEVYGEVLADRRIEDIEAAAEKFLRGAGNFMPTPGQWRKAALAAAAKRNGVAFIEGTGWISVSGVRENDGMHPDAIDQRDRPLLPAAPAAPRLAAVKHNPRHFSETERDDDEEGAA